MSRESVESPSSNLSPMSPLQIANTISSMGPKYALFADIFLTQENDEMMRSSQGDKELFKKYLADVMGDVGNDQIDDVSNKIFDHLEETIGQGVFPCPNGCIYTGEIRKGFQHGKGTYRHSNGDYYEGEWCEGNMIGRGEYRFSDGSAYIGQVKDGRQHGHGTCKYNDGDEYAGGWRDGKKHGAGVHKSPSGSLYDGEYKDGKQHGRGKFLYPDGGEYIGDWQAGKKHGRGRFVSPDGGVFEGDYFDGHPHGRGLHVCANGDEYEGEYQHGQRHGWGRCNYATGSVYEGNWANGKQVESKSKIIPAPIRPPTRNTKSRLGAAVSPSKMPTTPDIGPLTVRPHTVGFGSRPTGGRPQQRFDGVSTQSLAGKSRPGPAK